jgi:hypothetical protein
VHGVDLPPWDLPGELFSIACFHQELPEIPRRIARTSLCLKYRNTLEIHEKPVDVLHLMLLAMNE